MKLGLVGINTITQIIVRLAKRSDSNIEISLYDDDDAKFGRTFFECKLVGKCGDVDKAFRNGDIDSAAVCLGEKHLPKKREIIERLVKIGLHLPRFIDESAHVSELARLESGVVLNYGAIVGDHTTIKLGTILWSGAVVEHDSTIGACCYLGPNVTVSGAVRIGDCTLIGSGAVILPEVHIGSNCLIGAGAVVTKNISDNTRIVGVPAKPIGAR